MLQWLVPPNRTKRLARVRRRAKMHNRMLIRLCRTHSVSERHSVPCAIHFNSEEMMEYSIDFILLETPEKKKKKLMANKAQKKLTDRNETNNPKAQTSSDDSAELKISGNTRNSVLAHFSSIEIVYIPIHFVLFADSNAEKADPVQKNKNVGRKAVGGRKSSVQRTPSE